MHLRKSKHFNPTFARRRAFADGMGTACGLVCRDNGCMQVALQFLLGVMPATDPGDDALLNCMHDLGKELQSGKHWDKGNRRVLERARVTRHSVHQHCNPVYVTRP